MGVMLVKLLVAFRVKVRRIDARRRCQWLR